MSATEGLSEVGTLFYKAVLDCAMNIINGLFLARWTHTAITTKTIPRSKSQKQKNKSRDVKSLKQTNKKRIFTLRPVILLADRKESREERPQVVTHWMKHVHHMAPGDDDQTPGWVVSYFSRILWCKLACLSFFILLLLCLLNWWMTFQTQLCLP